MSSKISLLALIKSNSAFISHAQKQIVKSVSEYFPETGCFENFDNAKEMLLGLSTAFSRSRIVVAGADSSLFISLKKLLLQTLNLEGENSDTIMCAIKDSGEDISESSALSHALIPKGATVFVSDDGLFSGFAIKSGRQYLIVLPLDCARILDIIENGFKGYLETVLSIPAAPERETNENIAVITTKKLVESGLRAAISSTKTSDFFRRKLMNVPDSENVFKFVDCSLKDESLSQKELTADLGRQARENASSSVGAAISNVFSSKKESGRLFVFVAVADSERARVAKVYSEPEETPRQVVSAAVDTLFHMIGEYADTGGFTGFPVNETGMEIPAEELKGKRGLAFKLLLSGIAAVILCLIIILFGGRLVNAFKSNSDNGIFDGEVNYGSKGIPVKTDAVSAENTDNLSSDDFLSRLAQMSSYESSESETTVQTTTSAISRSELSLAAGSTTLPSSTVKTTSKITLATTKPTTIKQTTVAVITTATTAVANPSQYAGIFSITVKGYGHGVGMSQKGAIEYAGNQKWSYDKILLHYYQPDVTIIDDSSPPATVSYNGMPYALPEFLARTVAAEIGVLSPIEAMKAQAVAAYSFAKIYNFVITSSQSAFSQTFNMDSNSNVVKAVTAVLGKYLSFNGSTVKAFYFSSCAGQTVSSASVWGGSVPYLSGGITSPEAIAVSNKNIAAEDFRKLVSDYNLTCSSAKVITLQDNPADWLEIISKDSVGYVNIIKVGSQKMTGNDFRYYLLKLGIKSHCFTYDYKK